MKANVSRRSVIAGAGYAAACSVAGQLLAVVRAEEAAQAQRGEAGGICLSMIFEEGPKSTFDTAKYLKNHLPLLQDVYGDSVERIELRATEQTQTGFRLLILYAGLPSPQATTTFWIRDIAAFGQRLSANAARINKELDALANANRLVQTDRIVLALGESRSAITTDTFVVSLYYRQPKTATAAAVFDQKYFQESYLPALYAGLGPNAVRRIEASVGLVQGGQPPAVIAAFHVYIRDRDAFDLAKGALDEALKDQAKLTQNTTHMLVDMRVKGVV
jgi:hypothetical protein